MPKLPRPPARILLASLLLALFVVLDLALFGWLIFRSLSQREIESVLFRTRLEAEELAARIADRIAEEGEGLGEASSAELESQDYIDWIQQHRDVVRTVEIWDEEGRLVFLGGFLEPIVVGDVGAPVVGSLEVPLPPPEDLAATYDLDIPIGDQGMLHVDVAETELRRRLEQLRQELLGQTALIAAVTLVLLALAYAVIWWLWRRGRRLEEQTAEAERMAYVGTLASGLAHEIRNPLNSLNLNLQLLDEELAGSGDPGSPRRLMQITRSEIIRLERLVSDFLSYARSRPVRLERVIPATLFRHCREVLAPELEERGVELVLEDLSRGAWLCVDREQMGQVLLNLIQNAVAASEGVDAAVRLRAAAVGEQMVLEVIDRGPGIPAAEREKIFDLFYSTRKGGTGLGLAIARRIVSANGGEISVECPANGGTVLRLVLPQASKDCPPLAAS